MHVSPEDFREDGELKRKFEEFINELILKIGKSRRKNEKREVSRRSV